LVRADSLGSVHSAVRVCWYVGIRSGNAKPAATEAVAVGHLEDILDRRLGCSSDLYEVVGARRPTVGQGVVLLAADRVSEPGQLGPVRRAAGCVRYLLWDIAEAEGSNGKANVALATLSSPTDGILLA